MATIDLKTLPKWKELIYGNHTLQIVARAPEHSDSDKSAEIEFTREAWTISDNINTRATRLVLGVYNVVNGEIGTLAKSYTMDIQPGMIIPTPDTSTMTGGVKFIGWLDDGTFNASDLSAITYGTTSVGEHYGAVWQSATYASKDDVPLSMVIDETAKAIVTVKFNFADVPEGTAKIKASVQQLYARWYNALTMKGASIGYTQGIKAETTELTSYLVTYFALKSGTTPAKLAFTFSAIDTDGNELGATEQIKVESVSTETVTEVQATFVAKLATPQNVTANGTTVSWDAVESATSYDVYADDTTLLGSVTSQQSVDLTTLSGWANLTDGNHTIQIMAKADGYIDSDKSAGVEVTKSAPPKTLEESTWAEIAQVSANKSWDAMGWKVGDSKTITLNGTVGTLALNNYQCKVYIIGFDHNADKEGQGISFGLLEGMDGKQLCLIDQYYSNNTAELRAFAMNPSDNLRQTNAGGWKAAKMRKAILGSTDVENGDATPDTIANPAADTLMAALPADLRAVMKPITKYTDNEGGDVGTSAISPSIDYLPLMSEFEVFGAINFGNPQEQSHQARYEYYNSIISAVRDKYKHSDVAFLANWWLRSPRYKNVNSFCIVFYDGATVGTSGANSSMGVAPVFLV